MHIRRIPVLDIHIPNTHLHKTSLVRDDAIIILPYMNLLSACTGTLWGNVADPDPGSCAVLPPGSGTGDEFFPDPGSGPFLGEIFLHYLQNFMLSLRNWASLKTYS
jgi:hypothetical protein